MTVLRSGSATDVGRVRSSNQDLALETGTLFAVADGMGGHAGGEVASRVAVDSLEAAFGRNPTGAGLAAAVTSANEAVWQHSIEHAELRGMGTTLTAIALVDEGGRDMLALINVGDSRVYRFHDGELTQVTRDHSLAEEMVATGELTAAEATVHPHRHILTRALGVSPDVNVDLWRVRPTRGDRFVLCSDGLTNELDEGRIAEALVANPDPKQAADQLVQAARRHGGSDNITTVVVDVVIGEDDSGVTPAVLAVSPDFVPLVEPPVGQTTGMTSVHQPGSVPEAKVLNRRQRLKAGRRRRRSNRGRRLVTFRALLFTALFAAIAGGALYAIRWYEVDSYYVGLNTNAAGGGTGSGVGNEVEIYQGRIGGFLWYRPQVVQRTGLTVADLTGLDAQSVKPGVQLSSLRGAQNYVRGLLSDHQNATSPALPPSPPTTTTTTASPPALPTSTAVTTTTAAG